MNQKELKELIEFLIEKDIAEFELERGDVKVRIKRGRRNHGCGFGARLRHLPCPPRPTAPRCWEALLRSPPFCAAEESQRGCQKKSCTWCVLPS